MEIDKIKLEELIDYTWKLEEEIKEKLLQNFMELSKHHSEISKIRDLLIETEIKLKTAQSKPKTE